MKYQSMFVILTLVFLIAACGKQPPAVPEATPPAPEPAYVPPVVEQPAPVVEAPVLEETPLQEGAVSQPVMSEADQATIDRWKAACERGSASLCAALKTKYGIEMSPKSAAEATAEESATP